MGVLLLALTWSQVQFQDTHPVILELNLEARVRDRLSVSKCRPEYADRQDTGGACPAKFNDALHRTSQAKAAPSNDEMDSSWMAVRHRCAKLRLRSQLKPCPKGVHQMHSTTVAVDLAKNVFEL